jgi:hypothetical protein
MLEASHRKMAEAFVVTKGGVKPVDAAAMSDDQLAEHALAIRGYVVISREIAIEIDRVAALKYDVPLCELEAILYAIYSGAYGEYNRPLEFA